MIKANKKGAQTCHCGHNCTWHSLIFSLVKSPTSPCLDIPSTNICNACGSDEPWYSKIRSLGEKSWQIYKAHGTDRPVLGIPAPFPYKSRPESCGTLQCLAGLWLPHATSQGMFKHTETKAQWWQTIQTSKGEWMATKKRQKDKTW